VVFIAAMIFIALQFPALDAGFRRSAGCCVKLCRMIFDPCSKPLILRPWVEVFSDGDDLNAGSWAVFVNRIRCKNFNQSQVAHAYVAVNYTQACLVCNNKKAGTDLYRFKCCDVYMCQACFLEEYRNVDDNALRSRCCWLELNKRATKKLIAELTTEEGKRLLSA
jgi:hypothetical protein